MDEKQRLPLLAALLPLLLCALSCDCWFVARPDGPPAPQRLRQRQRVSAAKVLEGSARHSSIVLRNSLQQTSLAEDDVIRPTASPSRLPLKCRMQLQPAGRKLYSMQSRWTLDQRSLRCEWFAYNGRQMNSGNVFHSRAECENFCIRNITDPCQAAICEPQVEYETSRCEVQNDTACTQRVLSSLSLTSIHHGPPKLLQVARTEMERRCAAPVAVCRNFSPTSTASLYTSNPKNRHTAKPPARCTQPRDSGRCVMRKQPPLRQYYYNSAAKVCKYMQYFGCGGNDNRFPSIKECYDACGE